MLQFSRRVFVTFVSLICFSPTLIFAMGGTSIVASKGQPAHPNATWPEGVLELVNDPARTTGWNSWFSEWPNDVNQYAFDIETTNDLNRLIEKLSSVKSVMRQIRLSLFKEPKGLGWVTSLPEDNNVAVIFSMGDQARIDEWYKRVDNPFGKMEFIAAPVAVPPTLTIFVQNDAVSLDKLTIPNGITMTAGYVPTLFHRSNTTLEKKREAEAAQKAKAATDEAQEGLDSSDQAAADAIAAFLSARKNGNGKTE